MCEYSSAAGTLTNCYSKGTVSGLTYGGLVGLNSTGIISNCYYPDDVNCCGSASQTPANCSSFSIENTKPTLSTAVDGETDLLRVLNAWVTSEGTDYKSWVARQSDNYPIFGEYVIPEFGNLTVSKTVSGSGASTTKEFTFTVTLNNSAISGSYGEMTFKNGVATFTLKDGESMTASSLPAGVGYTIAESDNSGYAVTISVNGESTTTATDEIATNETDIVVFNNYKSSGGEGGGTTYYTLTFETNGGSEIDSVRESYGANIDLSDYTTTRDGYHFNGWYSDDELTEKITSIRLTGNKTVYAGWTESHKPEIMTDEHIAYIVGRSKDYAVPEENITRAEVATIFFRLLEESVREANLTTKSSFEDVSEGDWFCTEVSTLAKPGIVLGRGNDMFDPNAFITRGEFAAIAARFSDAAYEGEDLFSDIGGHWARDYINRSASLGWIVGDNGLFRPDDFITRAEAVTLVNRVLERQPESVEDLLEGMITFKDNADESAWYYLAIQEAANSHDYEMKTDGVHEQWTRLKNTTDTSGD